MRRALVILLVVVVVATGLPILMGMGGMASCEVCDPGVLMGMSCLAVLAMLGMAVPALRRAWVHQHYRSSRSRLLVHALERPPQIATG